MKQNSNVPAFLTKLWTLVEDADTNEFICWSQEGNSFLVLDEQRFAKEILPKFFKHNNMASFVRQLNMYGFRKVMHIDTGIVKLERDGPVEFQHPYFKHGQDDLLENIKRKVSNSRPEDGKTRQEDLAKILANMQNVQGKQESIDSRLATLKRENESLWREISDLRQKHLHQQQLIKKLIQFIVTLVQNNRFLNLKRKRPLLMSTNGKKPKYIHQIYEEDMDLNKSSVNGINGSEITDDVIICDVTDEDAEVAEETSRVLDQGDVEIIEVDFDGGVVLLPDADTQADVDLLSNGAGTNSEETALQTDFCYTGGGLGPEEDTAASSSREQAGGSLPTSSALQLNKPSALSLEDPVKMMDSILNESGAISQNINLLGKVELMDYLDSIDCSLEDFQALLYGKQFSIDPDLLEETDVSKGTLEQLARAHNTEETPADKQLIQYTSCPLMAFLDGCAPLPSDADALPCLAGQLELESDSLLAQPLLSDPSTSPLEEQPSTDLLEPILDTSSPPRSSLIRLEPLTEAEASEATLFYLCELPPQGAGTDPTQLDV
ncbi:heat shock factor protein 2 [Osmerus mordax]|uniref:heat shock factor protein 2 n=1 Tax=Osmerus mordax TaxID=8014 RepID=UPI003510C1D6